MSIESNTTVDHVPTAQQTIRDRYAAFEVPDNGAYNDNPELFQYFYHTDHLGSSSLITNLDAEIVQHVEYVPFMEHALPV